MKKIFPYLVGGIGIALLVFLGFLLLNKQGNDPTKGSDASVDLSQLILYYGETCPHCLIVNEYLEENKVKEKVAFAHLEVYKNKDNAKLLAESAQRCGIESDKVGVPLLWTEGRCLVGDKDIIDFFKEKEEGLK